MIWYEIFQNVSNYVISILTHQPFSFIVPYGSVYGAISIAASLLLAFVAIRFMGRMSSGWKREQDVRPQFHFPPMTLPHLTDEIKNQIQVGLTDLVFGIVLMYAPFIGIQSIGLGRIDILSEILFAGMFISGVYLLVKGADLIRSAFRGEIVIVDENITVEDEPDIRIERPNVREIVAVGMIPAKEFTVDLHNRGGKAVEGCRLQARLVKTGSRYVTVGESRKIVSTETITYPIFWLTKDFKTLPVGDELLPRGKVHQLILHVLGDNISGGQTRRIRLNLESYEKLKIDFA
jgi:hypothetical protein